MAVLSMRNRAPQIQTTNNYFNRQSVKKELRLGIVVRIWLNNFSSV